MDLPELWGSLEEEVSNTAKKEPTIQESLSEMQKARENQKQKVKSYMFKNMNLQTLKLNKKKSVETDGSSVGSPRKKVKRIEQV